MNETNQAPNVVHSVLLVDKDADEAYALTQTNDAIHDGTVIVFANAVAVMIEAWPVSVHGKTGALSVLAPGVDLATMDGGKYAKSAALVASLLQDEPEETKYDANPSLAQLQEAMAVLKKMRVAPGAVFAFATAIETIGEAAMMRADKTIEYEGTALDLCEEQFSEDMEDPADSIIDFWDGVSKMIVLIQGEQP